MYVHRALLLILLLLYIFTPSMQAWVTVGGEVWYRPYLIWAAVIAFTFWARHKSSDKNV